MLAYLAKHETFNIIIQGQKISQLGDLWHSSTIDGKPL